MSSRSPTTPHGQDVPPPVSAWASTDLRGAAIDLIRTFNLEPAPAWRTEKRNGGRGTVEGRQAQRNDPSHQGAEALRTHEMPIEQNEAKYGETVRHHR